MPAKKDNPFDGFELIDEKSITLSSGGGRADPVLTRRTRFLEGLEIQRQLFKNPNYTIERTQYVDTGTGQREGKKVQKSPRSWIKKGADGAHFVLCKYGSRTIELQPGLTVAKLDEKQVLPFFDKMDSLVNDGFFDEQFEKLASRKSG